MRQKAAYGDYNLKAKCLVCGEICGNSAFVVELVGLGAPKDKRRLALHHQCGRQLLLALAGYENFITIEAK